MSAVGVVLMVAGVVMVVLAMVRVRRSGAGEPAPVHPLVGWALPLGRSWRVVRAAQGRGSVPAGQVELVRTLARGEVGAPALSVVGSLGAGLGLAGVGALYGFSLLGALWLVPAAAVATLLWQVRARRRRARVVLVSLPLGGGR